MTSPPSTTGHPLTVHGTGGQTRAFIHIKDTVRCVEEEENDLAVRNDHFLALGLRPTTLSEGLLTEVREVAARYAHRADPRKIVARTVWRSGMPCGDDQAPVRLPPRGPPPVPHKRRLMRFAVGL